MIFILTRYTLTLPIPIVLVKGDMYGIVITGNFYNTNVLSFFQHHVEPERSVSELLELARQSAPCVIALYFVRAQCPKGGGSVRVVDQLCLEMDRVDTRQGVFVIATTHVPDKIDPTILGEKGGKYLLCHRRGI
jgi:ATPase family associated with various cellular activities (AAA)